jgi:hypothetical protein
MNDIHNDISVWLSNVNKLYIKRRISKKQKKNILGNNILLDSEMIFVRRLIIDWIVASLYFPGLRRYSAFKSLLLNHIKTFNLNDIYYDLFVDIHKFFQFHGDYLLDVFESYLFYPIPMRSKYKFLFFSVVCVELFYKWRKLRNDSYRRWANYNNRRKKAIKISKSSFDNIMLPKAERYRKMYIFM